MLKRFRAYLAEALELSRSKVFGLLDGSLAETVPRRQRCLRMVTPVLEAHLQEIRAYADLSKSTDGTF